MAGSVKHAQRSHRSHANHQMMANSFARTSAAHATVKQVKQAKKTQGILEGLKNMITHNTSNK